MHPVEGPVADGIKTRLLGLGFQQATSRDEANLLIWYSYHSESTGMRVVGSTDDIWGEQITTDKQIDLDAIQPVFFSVQFVSLEASRIPDDKAVIWRANWSATMPSMSMKDFVSQQITKVIDQYNSVETQNEITALRKMRERKLKAAVNNYMKSVMYRIQKNWRKPKYNVTGKKCKIKILQSAVGEIKSHKVLTCDKDRGFRRSIEKAIKKSSPLPLPKQDNFDRDELILIFQG